MNVKRLALLLSGLMALPASARQADVPPLWELGAVAFGVAQQAYPGAGERVNRGLALPYFIYRGKTFRVDRDGADIRAIKTSNFEFDIGVAAAFGSSDDVAVRRGMPELGTMVEFGPRMKWNLGRGAGGSRWRFELPARVVLDTEDGFRKKGVSVEPELYWERRGRDGWGSHASVGALLGDRQLNDTFYGVAPVYARVDRPAYVAGRGLIALRLSGGVSKLVTPDWRLFGFVRVDDVRAGKNRDSPLVLRNTGASVGFGVAYTWLRSAARANE